MTYIKQPTETRESGAFDMLRLLAAVAVIYSHSFALLKSDTNEALNHFTSGRAAFGELAVYAFFAMSGYLITQSWMRDPSLGRFMVKRILRLVPALAFVVVSCFALGSLVTGLSASDYFSRPEAWSYLGKIFIYPAQLALPDTFSSNPYPNVVNGSLWSLRLEFAFYAAVATLGLIGALRSRITNAAIVAFCLMMVIAIAHTRLFARVPFIHQTIVLFSNAVPFFVGAALAQYGLGRVVIFSAAALVLSTLLFFSTPAFQPLLLLALPFAVILSAQHFQCDLRPIGDYSYGLYLWAFPIQQTIISRVPTIEPFQLFIVATAATFAFAFLSWHLVEKRALALKPRQASGGNYRRTFLPRAAPVDPLAPHNARYDKSRPSPSKGSKTTL